MSVKNYFFEEYESDDGEKHQRIKSGIFYWSSFWSFIIGVILFANEAYRTGITLILTACPVLALYPLVRFLFGGKDNVWSAVSTFILEEFLKGQAVDFIERKKRKRKC